MLPRKASEVYCTTYRCLQRGQKAETGVSVDHKMPLRVFMLLSNTIKITPAAPMLRELLYIHQYFFVKYNC